MPVNFSRVSRPSLPAAATIGWACLLVVLTLAWLGGGISPIDQRTGEAIPGASLTMPGYQSIIEPFTAPFYMLAGAPDFKKAALSTTCWLFAFASLAYFLIVTRRRVAHWMVRAIDSVLFGFGVLLLFLLYLFFAVITPFPSWSLFLSESDSAIADLHSHTAASYDAFATADDSVRLHRARGYGVVAWTEHYPSTSPVPFRRTSHRNGVDVIGGFEIVASVDGTDIHLIVLGVPESTVSCESADRCLTETSVRELVDLVHQKFHGAVLVNNADLTPHLVNRLADLGVDGFEIANQGHPTYSHAVQEAILSVQRTRGLSTIAVSDWHGWGGLIRTWTVVRGVGKQESDAEAIIDILRSRAADRVIPVVAQPFAIPSVGRVLFAPFAELVRYGHELSPARALSWWVWSAVLLGVFARLRRRGLDPAGVCVLVVAGGLGIGVIVQGLPVLLVGLAGARHAVARNVGAAAILSGVIALLYVGLSWRQLTRSLLAISPAAETGQRIAARFPALVASMQALRNVRLDRVLAAGWQTTGVGWVGYSLVLSIIATAVTATPESTAHAWHETIEVLGIVITFAGGGLYIWTRHRDMRTISQSALELPVIVVGLGAAAQSGSFVAAAAVALLTWLTIRIVERSGGGAWSLSLPRYRASAAVPQQCQSSDALPLAPAIHDALGAVIVVMALAMIPIAELIEHLQAAGILPVLFHLN